jgi:hypothetical protein
MDGGAMDETTQPGEAPADEAADQPKKKKKFSLKDALEAAKDSLP